MIELYENERLDEVNDKLRLIQKTDGLTFGTDALLLGGYIKGGYRRGIELGGGSGIISMLLLTREKLGSADCAEVQKEYAELIGRNAELNSLSDRLFPVFSDIRDLPHNAEYDIVYTNPPYMKADSGYSNAKDKKNIARHEVFGTIDDFCKVASKILKFGGTFAIVYRPDRICDLIYSMRSCHLEPKRITFVHARADAEPSMVLIEARLGGGVGAMLTRPLIIYGSGENYTDDMNYIMENGSFPADFYTQARAKGR